MYMGSFRRFWGINGYFCGYFLMLYGDLQMILPTIFRQFFGNKMHKKGYFQAICKLHI